MMIWLADDGDDADYFLIIHWNNSYNFQFTS